MKLTSGLVAALIALTLPTLAVAEKLRKDYTRDDLVSILKAEGYSSVNLVGDEIIEIKVDGRSYYLTIYDDGDLQLYFGITGHNLSTEDMNEWNQTRRLSRAYLDDENDPIIEADLLANAGYTSKQMLEFVAVFVASADVFRQFLIQRDGAAP